MRPRIPSLIPTLRQAIASFVLAAAILFLNDQLAFESIVVPSSSMRPTVLPNERMFLQKIGYGDIHRFDIVVVRNRVSGERIIKRVVGMPGDHFRLVDSYRVYINGKSMEYSAPDNEHVLIEANAHRIQLVRNPKFFYETKYGGTDLLLGPDEYFVLGDNRLASEDSRFFGPIHLGDIAGKPRLIWYSYDLQAHRLRTDRIMTTLR